MKNIRTDLATERHEFHGDTADIVTRKIGNVTVSETVVQDGTDAEKMKLPQGRYISLSFQDPHLKADADDIEKAICESLEILLNPVPKSVLIIGLGNREVAPDALGAFTCDLIQPTRHLAEHPLFEFFCSKGCRVSVISAGVLSNTGIESADISQAIARQIKPDAAIIIDALAARRPARLCRTIQLSNAGIVPASGYGGDRPAINSKLLGIPVVGVGVPTVIDSRTYRLQFGAAGEDDGLILTPTDIGKSVIRCAKLLSAGINRYLGTNF